jgi:hypothetical protein
MRALHLHAPSAAPRRAALRRPAPRAACSQPAQRLAPHAPLARRRRRVCRAGEGESGGAEHLAVAAEEAVDDGEFWAKDLTDKVLVPDPEEEARAVAAAARSAALTWRNPAAAAGARCGARAAQRPRLFAAAGAAGAGACAARAAAAKGSRIAALAPAP